MNKETFYNIPRWKMRALAYAKSLRGRPLDEDEQDFRDKYPDPADYFRVFGMQPETQKYIDETIRQLEDLQPEDKGLQLVAEIRLKWSVKALKEAGLL